MKPGIMYSYNVPFQIILYNKGTLILANNIASIFYYSPKASNIIFAILNSFQ